MYNSPSVHEAVMREYERMRNENEKKLEQRRNAVYEIVPAIAQIDRQKCIKDYFGRNNSSGGRKFLERTKRKTPEQTQGTY